MAMRNILENEDATIVDAVAWLLAVHNSAYLLKQTDIRTLALLLVPDDGKDGMIVLSGCDTDECRTALINLASELPDLPRTTIN